MGYQAIPDQRRSEPCRFAFRHSHGGIGCGSTHKPRRCSREEAGYDFRTESPFSLKTSAIVGRVELVTCVPVEDLDAFQAGRKVESLAELAEHLPKVDDDSWKYVSGPICWLIANVEPCEPVACNGKLGLWTF